MCSLRGLTGPFAVGSIGPTSSAVFATNTWTTWTTGQSVQTLLNLQRCKVYGENTEFYWLVHASRKSIIIEPNKKDINVNLQIMP